MTISPMLSERQKNSCDYYRAFLKRIDHAVGGLDEALDRDGAEHLAEWARTTDLEPFATYRSNARAVLKRYSLYRLGKLSGQVDESPDVSSEEVVADLADTITADANFLREREMQTQVRLQLGTLEPGLVAIDGGIEVSVATGRIDILARDAEGRTVVIELKPGKCPAGALEQLLAYAYDIEQEHGTGVRAMLVAGSFSDRIRAAARRAGGVELRTYAYSLNFATLA
ncbi:endonuclease NucS domain-containing protein [Sphingomonas sp. Leaf4]|uniref:endonuclease NucS domain-containing protein n=1 Tax=Sphingomonas sp. Leaf4 TaxID=2876553 RepID=UPI001E2A3F1F|nr:endonuclease NucS domain-containing protein [Sphingomonas sp. Leaf4]